MVRSLLYGTPACLSHNCLSRENRKKKEKTRHLKRKEKKKSQGFALSPNYWCIQESRVFREKYIVRSSLSQAREKGTNPDPSQLYNQLERWTRHQHCRLRKLG